MFLPFRAMRGLAGLTVRLTVLLALLLPLSVTAADLGVVKVISEGDDRGSFRKVDMSAGTVCIRGGVSTPLRPGFDLQDGDRITTTRARVELKLGDGIQMLVQEGADVVLGLRRIEQKKGGVFYQVDAPFEVAIDGVLVAVEGTRFLVEGADPVAVAVDNGQIRVTSKEEPVLLTRGERVETKQGHVPGGVRSMTFSMRKQAWEGTWLAGEPPLSMGLLVGGGLVGGAGLSTRLYATYDLPFKLEVLLDLGVGLPVFGRGGVLMPMGLGAAYELGPVSVGAEFLTAFDSYTKECGGAYKAFHLGGVAVARAGLPLSRRLSAVGALRAGYVGQPLVDLGVGVGMGF